MYGFVASIFFMVLGGAFASQPEPCRKFYSEQKYVAALYVCGALAKIGDPYAQLRLGKMYEDGLGVQKDSRKALEYYFKADNQNVKLARYVIGLYCLKNKEDKGSNDKACKRLDHYAYKDKDPVGMSLIGAELIRNGKISEGFRLMEQSAESEYPLAMFTLGIMAQQKDYYRSYVWLKLAQKFRDEQAIANKENDLESIMYSKVNETFKNNGVYLQKAIGQLTSDEIKKADLEVANWHKYSADNYDKAVSAFLMRNLYYPTNLKGKIEKPIEVTFFIGRDGTLISHDYANQAVVFPELRNALDEIIRKLPNFPKAPKDYKPRENKLNFDISIVFAE